MNMVVSVPEFIYCLLIPIEYGRIHNLDKHYLLIAEQVCPLPRKPGLHSHIGLC